jgi:hypothetical protein
MSQLVEHHRLRHLRNPLELPKPPRHRPMRRIARLLRHLILAPQFLHENPRGLPLCLAAEEHRLLCHLILDLLRLHLPLTRNLNRTDPSLVMNFPVAAIVIEKHLLLLQGLLLCYHSQFSLLTCLQDRHHSLQLVKTLVLRLPGLMPVTG